MPYTVFAMIHVYRSQSGFFNVDNVDISM